MKNWSICFIATCLLAIAVCSCSKQTEGELPVIDIVESITNPVEINLSEIAASIDYIPLETRDDVLLSGYMDLYVGSNSYICIDAQKQSDVVFSEFDLNGKFIRSVGTRGRAYGEVLRIKSAEHTKESGITAVWSSGNKIVRYKDGAFLDEINLNELDIKMGPSQMVALDNEHYFIKYSNLFTSKVMALIVNAKAEVVQHKELTGFEMITQGEILMIPSMNLHRVGSSFVLLDDMADTLYSYNYNLEKTPSYLFNSKEMVSISRFIGSDKVVLLTAVLPKAAFPNLPKGQITGNFILNNGSFNAVKYNPGEPIQGLVNDIDGGAPFWPKAIDGNRLYQTINADDFIEIAAASNSAKMKEVAATLTEESNPVLVVVALK